MSKNPWAVNSVEAFSCLKCPECPFTTNQETFFQEHAVEKHTLSIALFGMIFHRNNATTITIHERFTKLRKRKSIHHGKWGRKKIPDQTENFVATSGAGSPIKEFRTRNRLC